MKIVIIDYGAGNVQSVLFALKRLGHSAILSKDANEIITADKVIFPGVGHANAAMDKLGKEGLIEVIQNLKQPVLGICLGMQLLCQYSEEGDTKGLGIFDEQVKRFENTVKVPKMGWNSIHNIKSSLFDKIAPESFFYFVHSYYVPFSESTIAMTNYQLNYAAAIKKNNFYGCQFHPEKSGDLGDQVLKNFTML